MLRAWRVCFLLLLIAIFLWIVLISLTTGNTDFSLTPISAVSPSYTETFSITLYPHRLFKKSSQKVILLWTDYFGSKDWDFRNHFLQSCKNVRCHVTSDRTRLSESDAVLFNSRSLDRTKVLPRKRTPDQIWVIHNSEPPYYLYMDWNRYNGVFNWTSWFRRDADVYSPYGNFKKRSINTNITVPNIFAMKKNLFYWAASSCTDRNRRYRMIGELEKYINIDTYGACGRLVCPKRSAKCDTIFRGYKFVFAFENGQCRDYVTEKFWGALLREQIPVVMGGADYKAIAPPGSFINIQNFKTVQDLAAHLTRVGRNDTLYNSYFSWRKTFEVTEDQVVDWCGLCSALHDPRKPAQVYTDLKAWVAADNCKLYSLWDYITDNLARLSYLLGV